MEKPYILHLFTPMAQASPFDVNMAYDAGYDAVVPYTHVVLDQVAALTQDAIFSRGPKGAKRTGIFIGGCGQSAHRRQVRAAAHVGGAPFPELAVCRPSRGHSDAPAH